jgi:hypothetical protein
MDYLASAIGIAAFTLLMSLWVHTPVRGTELAPISASIASMDVASR